MPKEIRLHVGCGKKILPGYVNIDILPFPGVDVVADISKLPFDDNYADFIYSCANLEHFGRKEWKGVVRHWYAKLKPGGTIRISTNDFEAASMRYANTKNLEELLGLLIGGQKDEYDWHGMIFDFPTLKQGLEEAGFENVRRYDWRRTDIGRMGIDGYSQAYLPHMDKERGTLMMLNVEADKPTLKGRPLNVAYVPNDPAWLENVMFDGKSKHNMNGVFGRYIAAKNFLKERNVNLNTVDIYKTSDDVDVWVIHDPQGMTMKQMWKYRVNPRRTVLFMIEPPVANYRAWKYFRWYQWLFPAVLTWRADLADLGSRYVRWYFPVDIDRENRARYLSEKKRNLCMCMHSNKSVRISGEKYSLRREIIRYFETRGDKLMDVYGWGWNDDSAAHPFHTALYHGTSDDKYDTYAKYYYALCIDNSVLPGYITYDPFIAMAAGTVPIYLPMPDSHYYIPRDTYVDLTDFKSYDDLVVHLKRLVEAGEWEAMRDRGWEFINSGKFWPFTMEKFAEDFYRAVRKARG